MKQFKAWLWFTFGCGLGSIISGIVDILSLGFIATDIDYYAALRGSRSAGVEGRKYRRLHININKPHIHISDGKYKP